MVHARDLIHRSLDGELAPEEEVRLGSHLRECAPCRVAESELRRNDILLARREPLPEAPPIRPIVPPRSVVFLPAVALAGTALVALLVGNALAGWRTGSAPESSVAAAPSAVVPSVGVCGQAQEVATRGVTRLESVRFKRLALRDLLSGPGAQLAATNRSDAAARLETAQVCVVEVVGDVPPIVASPRQAAREHWAIYASVAGSGEPVGAMSGAGAPPAFFDALPTKRVDLIPGTVVEVVDEQTISFRFESPMMSQEFGNPARFFADRFTDIRPAAGTLANTGVKAGDRVQIFFERDGRDARGAYPLSSFLFIPSGVATPQVAPRPAGLPICPPGQLPVLDVQHGPPPGDQPGSGAASAEEAFRRTYPTITDFTMYPLGSGEPTRDPRGLGPGPIWVVAGSQTFVSMYIGEPGLRSWFAHPATFVACRDLSARATEVGAQGIVVSNYVTPPPAADCNSVTQAALPATPTLYPTRTAVEVTAGLRTDPYFRHTLEDIAGVRQDPNPLRDPGVPRCAVDALRTGEPIFVRSYPSEAGLWYVPVIYGDRQVLLITVGRNEAGTGVSGGSVGGGGGSGGMFPPMSRAKALQLGGTSADPAASAELVFASAGRGSPSVAWRIVRTSGSVFYLFPDFPGAGPDGQLFPESQVVTGP